MRLSHDDWLACNFSPIRSSPIWLNVIRRKKISFIHWFARIRLLMSTLLFLTDRKPSWETLYDIDYIGSRFTPIMHPFQAIACLTDKMRHRSERRIVNVERGVACCVRASILRMRTRHLLCVIVCLWNMRCTCNEQRLQRRREIIISGITCDAVPGFRTTKNYICIVAGSTLFFADPVVRLINANSTLAPNPTKVCSLGHFAFQKMMKFDTHAYQ